MATAVVEAFERMGARARVGTIQAPSRRGRLWNGKESGNWRAFGAAAIQIDILRDVSGQYFDIRRRGDIGIEVSEVVPNDRHLVLRTGHSRRADSSSSFLCGHDERAWFVAAIPEAARARTVQAAKDALKPQEVWDAMEEFGVPMEERDLRRTAAFVRQGEWFFIPCPAMDVGWADVLYNEPIQRGAGKPHRCEAMMRREGELVYVSEAYPNGLTEEEYWTLPAAERRRNDWERRIRNAEVFVRGRIRHGDHATITLPYWHKVVMNTETRARAMENVAFLD